MFFFSTRSLDTVGCCGYQINMDREWLFSCRRRCVYDWEWTGKDKRTWPSVGRKWPSCLVIGGAHEKIALSSLLTAQTERKLSQSVEGQTATHPPHFLSLSTRPPNWKVFSIGERRSSQLPDALDFRSLTKTLSSRHRTTKSLTQVHISKYFSIRVRVSSSYWVCIIVPAVIQYRYGKLRM
jgi:hypothetical protein